MDWLRVNKRRPCPICGRHDWCSIAGDGTAANCPRSPNDRPIVGRSGNLVGYLHKLDEPLNFTSGARSEPPEKALTPPELEGLMARYRTAINPHRLAALAERLGLSEKSLNDMGIGWAHDRNAWAFPMTDGEGRVLGIRLRGEDGKKWSVKGGHEGLFVPAGLLGYEKLFVCEGPTSCAALLDLGYEAIGRPSCTGGTQLVANYVRRDPRRLIVIVGDHDEPKERPDGSTFHPGQDGAEALGRMLLGLEPQPNLKILVPPRHKDFRDWLKAGATMALVDSIVRSLPMLRRTAKPRPPVYVETN